MGAKAKDKKKDVKDKDVPTTEKKDEEEIVEKNDKDEKDKENAEKKKELEEQERKKSAENKKEEVEVKRKDDEASDEKILPMGVIDLLAAIAETQTAHTDIVVKPEPLGALGYGPKEWILTIEEKCTIRYKVIKVNEENNSLIVKIPITSNGFKDFDTFIVAMMKTIDDLVPIALKMYREPKHTTIHEVLVIEPEALGIPYTDLCESNVPQEELRAAIAPLCNTRRAQNPNFSTGHVAEGLDLSEVRRRILDISRVDMRTLRNRIDAHYQYVMDASLDREVLLRLTNNDLLNLCADPFLLNEMFDHMPRRCTYSSALVLELLTPEISLSPINASDLLTCGSQNANKMTTLSSFAGVGFKPSMQKEISAYFVSLLCPGYVNFEIDLSDLPKDDIYLACFAALGAKLLFSYSEAPRWSSVTRESVRTVEQAICKAALAANFLVNAGIVNQLSPLANMIPARRVRAYDLRDLCTTEDGMGWREWGRNALVEHPEGMPYAACQLRPRYVLDVDDVRIERDEEKNAAYTAWRTRAAVSAFLNQLASGKTGRTPLSGCEGVIGTISCRLIEFFCEVNDYNRRNWYTSVRLTERSMDNLFATDDDVPSIMPMSGKTILFMLKSLDKGTIRSRKSDYLVQVRLEAGLMRDCIETSVRARLRDNIFQRYGLPREHYTRSEYDGFIMPREGPLSCMIEHMKKIRYFPLLRNFYFVAEQAPITEMMNLLANIVLENPNDFGVSESMIFRTRVRRDRVAYLRELSDAGNPYTNVFNPNQEVNLANRIINPRALQRLATNFSVMENLRTFSIQGLVTLELPAPFEVSLCSFKDDDTLPIKIHYKEIESSNNLRNILEITPRKLKLVLVDPHALEHPDIYLKEMSMYDGMFIQQDEYFRMVQPLRDWLAQIGLNMRPTTFVRTTNVRIISIFDRTL